LTTWVPRKHDVYGTDVTEVSHPRVPEPEPTQPGCALCEAYRK
jgi:hypothetical protein